MYLYRPGNPFKLRDEIELISRSIRSGAHSGPQWFRGSVAALQGCVTWSRDSLCFSDLCVCAHLTSTATSWTYCGSDNTFKAHFALHNCVRNLKQSHRLISAQCVSRQLLVELRPVRQQTPAHRQ